ncbi:MAG: DUF1501 domain-containing protein [Gemmataceae bacterium]
MRDRRQFLRLGLTAFGSLSLPALLRLRAQAAAPTRERTAVIVVWLRGGMSHLDTYDPKPDAPSEYRGPFASVATRVPGLRVTELLPRHARIADHFTLLRSLAHTGGGHPSGSLQLLTGDTDIQDKPGPGLPDFMSVAASICTGTRRARYPNYVGVNPISTYDNFTIAGPAYLGAACGPFEFWATRTPPTSRSPNIGLSPGQAAPTLFGAGSRLRDRFDLDARDLDNSEALEAMDAFGRQAIGLLTSAEARRAFDLTLEPEHIRARYGRHAWGQQCLMARRLVEAGVDIVTTTFDGPQCGRVGNWDDHAVNHHIFDALQYRAPFFDQAVTALIEDLYARGLDRRVLLIVTGEFGRTPRITNEPSSGPGVASAAAGTVQPGRDHWPRAGAMLFAGGGMSTGQVIGATDRRGEDVISRRMGPQDFLATVYQHLGIDFERVTIRNFSGRPVPIVTDGRPFPELSPG